MIAALDHPPAPDAAWDPAAPDPATSGVAPWPILNLGASRRVQLMHHIEVLEAKLGKKAELNLMPMQPGDVARTEADAGFTCEIVGHQPKTFVETGVGRFAAWRLQSYRGT